MNIHDTKMISHRTEALIENAEFLMNTCNMTLEATARRLGVEMKTLEKLLARHRG